MNTMLDTIEIADAAALLAQNQAAAIVNRASLRQMEGHFSPAQCDPIKVARVGADGALRIVDGFTRTAYVAAHAHLPFRLRAVDVTADLLANPTVRDPAPAGGRDALTAQDALTAAEYLRALIPPTVCHAEIAEKRVACYIALAWTDLVGAALAARYSALAALWTLETNQRTVPLAVTPAEKAQIEHALQIVQGVLLEAELASPYAWKRLQITRALLGLMVLRDPALGGDEASARQVYGLLHQDHLVAVCPDPAERAGLAVAILRYIRREGAGTTATTVLMRALDAVSLPDLRAILASAAPDETLAAVQTRQRLRLFTAAYQAQYRTLPPPTGTEILTALAASGTLAPSTTASAAHRGEAALGVAEGYWDALARCEADVAGVAGMERKGGVWANRTKLEDYMARIRAPRSLEELDRAVEAVYAIGKYLPDLLDRLRAEAATLQAVNQAFAPELAANPGLREPLLDVALREKGAAGQERAVADLRALPPPLLHATLTGMHTLPAARQIAQERAPAPPPPSPTPLAQPGLVMRRAMLSSLLSQATEIARDLAPDDLDADGRAVIDAAVLALGRLRYGLADLPELALTGHAALQARYGALLARCAEAGA